MSQPKVTIVGLGKIGASMGLVLRKAQPDFTVVGHDKDAALSRKAQDLGAIEKWERNLLSAVEDAELVIISTSAPDIRKVMESVGPHLGANCVVTDTAGVKGDVMRWADELLPETVHFVGGHPIVSQRGGDADTPRADLFTGCTYCLVPSTRSHPAAIELVTSMAVTLGAEPFFLDVDEHDGQIAAVEHLPVLLSAALLLSTTQAPSWRDLRRLPGETFWRATEFPSPDPGDLGGACLANKENISRWIDAYVNSLKELQEKLVAAEDGAWQDLFTELMDIRTAWLAGRGTPDEEASTRTMEDLRSMTSLGSLLGLNQFRDFKKRVEGRAPR